MCEMTDAEVLEGLPEWARWAVSGAQSFLEREQREDEDNEAYERCREWAFEAVKLCRALAEARKRWGDYQLLWNKAKDATSRVEIKLATACNERDEAREKLALWKAELDRVKESRDINETGWDEAVKQRTEARAEVERLKADLARYRECLLELCQGRRGSVRLLAKALDEGETEIVGDAVTRWRVAYDKAEALLKEGEDADTGD